MFCSPRRGGSYIREEVRGTRAAERTHGAWRDCKRELLTPSVGGMLPHNEKIMKQGRDGVAQIPFLQG